MPFLRTDHWRCAVIHASFAQIVAHGSLDGFAVTPLPAAGDMRFTADPFGIWHDGALHVFAEHFDYRDRVGTIIRMQLDATFQVVETRTILQTGSHLSYPVPMVYDGQICLLPEAARSGRLSLYRADADLNAWHADPAFSFPFNAIDASPVWYGGRWWMFYTPVSNAKASRQGVLHAAYAETLHGPWTEHPANPLVCDRAGARPGGTPVIQGGKVVLPVQDCVGTYGAAIRLLHIWIDPTRVEIRIGARLTAPYALSPDTDGLHTLSAAGDVTLIDVKRIGYGARRHMLDIRRKARGFIGL